MNIYATPKDGYEFFGWNGREFDKWGIPNSQLLIEFDTSLTTLDLLWRIQY